MAFHVAQRVREIGVRMALGARRRQVVWGVFSRGARLTALGILLGALLALASQQLLTGLLYGVTSTDAATFLAVVGLLGVVATGAILIHARRATKVDPIVALRCE
jgi:ABC-type antimicrobial peptide transport system permease subunit